jgi:hypothetical protein
MKKSVLLLTAAAISIALGGCTANSQAVTVGGTGKSTTSAAPVEQGERGILTNTQVAAALPTAAELGATWVDGKTTSDSSGNSDTGTPTYSPASCAFSSANGSLTNLALVPKSQKALVSAEADFLTPAQKHASRVVPVPANGSSTSYPGLVARRTSQFMMPSGFTVGPPMPSI